MVTKLHVKVIPTIPLTVGTMIAVGFDPMVQTSEAGNPTDYSDVLISKHHVTCNQTVPKSFTVNVSDYYNDWKSTTLLASEYNNCTAGVLQWFSSYDGGGTSGAVIGYLDIEFEIAFTGLKR